MESSTRNESPSMNHAKTSLTHPLPFCHKTEMQHFDGNETKTWTPDFRFNNLPQSIPRVTNDHQFYLLVSFL